jgi:ABC-2 type transport system ATP-binding protein
MALVNDPEVLFLDEPTSGLDVESARLLREKIVQYDGEGKTVFLSTHNMEEANQLCHRIAIINHGKIAAIDTPENLRAQSMDLQYIEAVICFLVEYAKKNDLRIISLNTMMPSLEDVFLKLTKRKEVVL